MTGPDAATPAIETRGLTRVFRAGRGGRETVALAGIDLRIERGEIFGLLGPNGAGKTTCIKILTTLLFPTAGTAWVAGIDVVADPNGVRRRINLVSGGESSGYGILTVRECLWMFSQFYGVPGRVARERIERLVAVADLAEFADSRINRLSTGQRQRMNFARGFVSDPDVLFLDEPTLGMDVTVARRLRAFVADWVRERPARTVLLTTHYLAEADELCDRIAIVDRGRVLACDRPAALRRSVRAGQHVELEVVAGGAGADGPPPAVDGLALAWGAPHPEHATRTLKFTLPEGRRLVDVLHAIESQGLRVEQMSTRETSLEDAFMAITGRGLDDEGAAEPRP